MRRLLLFAALTIPAAAQWTIQTPATAADLRGIDNVGKGIAWASGTDGTVLRTEDNGYLWQRCATPPNADHLDFRGIQAFDANTAIVMSSGKGDLSRLYKTTDGCQTWKLVLTNPDSDGFWDAIQMVLSPLNRPGQKTQRVGTLIGDPVSGKFVEFDTRDDGDHWSRRDGGEAGIPSAANGESLFAASNSALIIGQANGIEIFVTGGTSGSRSRILTEYVKHDPRVSWKFQGGDIPIGGSESSGAFSVAIDLEDPGSANIDPKDKWTLLYAPKGVCVAVGGDYKRPEEGHKTAALTLDSGLHWLAATTPPHGYRSAVAYDAPTKTWITVGPNGTDISTDDGRNWHPLLPTPGEAPDTDRNWNALSLPFVVGPHGRIGILNPTALKPPTKTP